MQNVTRQIGFYFKRIWLLCLMPVICLLTGCGGITADDIALATAVKQANCWPCTAYRVVWDAIGSVVTNAYPFMCQSALSILGLALMFWLMMTAIKLVGALKEPNLKEFIPKISSVLFKSFVVAAVLSSGPLAISVVDIIVTPVLTAFISLSRAILFAEPTIAKHFVSVGDFVSAIGNHLFFSSQIGSQVEDVIYRLYLAFNSGLALGGRMMLIPDFMSWIIGLFTMMTFFFFMLFFPLLFLEGFVNLGMIIVLFPIFLVAWVFPSSKEYIKRPWEILFQAAAQILITCIYVGVLVNVLKSYSNSFSLTKQLTDPALLLGIKNMSNSGLAFFALIFCMFKLSNDIPAITSFFVGDIARSGIAAKFAAMGRMLVGAGKVVVGAALASAGLGAVGKGMMADGAQSSKDALKNTFGDGNDGEGSAVSVGAEQAAQTRPKG